jgi:hypothetical protein
MQQTSTTQAGQTLFSFEDSARILRGLSPWTLRRHAQRGNIRTVRLGLRVFLDSEELERIRREGLPRLTAKSTARESDRSHAGI